MQQNIHGRYYKSIPKDCTHKWDAICLYRVKAIICEIAFYVQSGLRLQIRKYFREIAFYMHRALCFKTTSPKIYNSSVTP